jgi:hypothetical protein
MKKTLFRIWARCRIVVHLLLCVVGLAVVMLSLAIMGVSLVRLLFPRT